MKFSPLLLALLLLSFISSSTLVEASCRRGCFLRRPRCGPICRPRRGCRRVRVVRRHVCTRKNGRRICRTRRRRVKVRGYRCIRRRSTPQFKSRPPTFTTAPPPSGSTPCLNVCFRWWKQARFGCHRHYCQLTKCRVHGSYGNKGWVCKPRFSIPGFPIVSKAPLPSVSPLVPSTSASPGPRTCFGGCKTLAKAREGCDSRFCVTRVCFRRSGKVLYSCVPKLPASAIPTAKASPAVDTSTATPSPGTAITLSPAPIVCASVCITQKTLKEVSNTCNLTACKVVRCVVQGSGVTGYGCIGKTGAVSPVPTQILPATSSPTSSVTPSATSTATVSSSVSGTPSPSLANVSPSVSGTATPTATMTPSNGASARIFNEGDASGSVSFGSFSG